MLRAPQGYSVSCAEGCGGVKCRFGIGPRQGARTLRRRAPADDSRGLPGLTLSEDCPRVPRVGRVHGTPDTAGAEIAAILSPRERRRSRINPGPIYIYIHTKSQSRRYTCAQSIYPSSPSWVGRLRPGAFGRGPICRSGTASRTVKSTATSGASSASISANANHGIAMSLYGASTWSSADVRAGPG